MPLISRAQIATASFDRSMLSINPAAAATREIKQVALFETFKNSKSNLDQERDDSANAPWVDKTSINRFGTFLTGGHSGFTPELYLSMDHGERSLSLDEGSAQKQTSKTDMINNMLNLAFTVDPNLALGLKFYAPSYSYTENYEFTYADNKTIKQRLEHHSNIIGLGTGLSMHLINKIYLGAYYVNNTDKSTYKTNYTYTDGNVSKSYSKKNLQYAKYGAALSYLYGHRSNGARFELGYSKMRSPSQNKLQDGEEILTNLEISVNRITFGVNAKLRKNYYLDHTELMEYIVGERQVTRNFSPFYAGFISFGSEKGHTIGASILYVNSKGTKEILGQSEAAKTKLTGITVDYAYLY